ncbi:Crp/Fnr family transcriptional regulator [Oceanihabitans sp. IOP_32]|uniref:Crp/Fnr family transcriptional regulator n=1 Tax=Oceanihabitans sp. IOP_32 TaxID=2529032 RepID=UPI0012933A39|nr:Crp/Fnr family transcriptional regulator [Oceanihabitans sp. IOP_32]QFZ54375.1 Crp/Fnr family transcriptional regulator [Oceanihabitans sp. IOP_32]
MNINFFQSIYNHPLIAKNDLNEIMDAHEKINFSKGRLFLESGKMANSYGLIEKGLVRAYVHDFNGKEITTDFYSTNEISIEVSSLFQRVPTIENIVALTNGVAWQIEFDKFQELFHKIEGFREWGRAWMSGQLFVLKQRKMEMLTQNATQRYNTLINDKPAVLRHASIKHMASYLGITDTSLSRIRKEILFD